MKENLLIAKVRFLAVALLLCIIISCDRKASIPPEASSHVTETDETIVEAELSELQEDSKPSTLQLQNNPEMVFVEGGIFDFHGKKVEVDDFYIAKHELTPQAVYHFEIWAIKNGNQKEHIFAFSDIDNRPIQLSWYDALYICNLLSMQSGYRPVYYLDPGLLISFQYSDLCKIPDFIYLDKDPEANVGYSFLNFYIDNTADGFRLPTEVEWEYAARGGKKSRGYIYSGSNTAEDVAWFGKPEQNVFQVGNKKGNELGLYDMSGNAHEWCIDYWRDEPLTDTTFRNKVYFYEVNSLSKTRVIKGGFNFDTNGIYEKSIIDYLCPDVRLKLDLYRYRYHDDTSSGLGNLSTSLVVTESGIRLVQKQQK